MRALYIYTHGFPEQDGHSTTSRLSWFHLQTLARRAEIDLLALVPLREKDAAPSSALRALCRHIEIVPVPASRSEAIGSVSMGLLRGLPPAFALKLSGPAEAFLLKALAEKTYGLLVTQSPFGLANLPLAAYRSAGFTPPILLALEEVQWTAWRGYRPWQFRTIGAQQAIQSLLWRRMKRLERFYGRLASLVLCLSPREEQAMRELDPAIRTALLPLPVNTSAMTPSNAPHDSHTILFTGHFGHPPNRMAAIELARQVFPLVRKEVPKAHLLLAGWNASSLASLTMPGIRLADSPASLTPLYQSATVTAGPIRTGEGVRGKFLEALSCGCPVVTTPLGASGIEVSEEEGLLVADTPRAMAGAIVRLMHSPAGVKQLGIAAAEAVRRRHSPDAFARSFDAGLDRLLAEREGAS
jgi:glycosyltransferase involved in cell wall biosynthesis